MVAGLFGWRQTAAMIGGKQLKLDAVKPSVSATAVKSSNGVLTVGVGRSRIHAFGSNGWDLYLWMVSWVSRVLHRDTRWGVTVREGRPELMSGTQALVSTEQFETYAAARGRALQLLDEIRSVP